jgi:hypothetical protein
MLRWALSAPSYQGGNPPTETEARRAFRKEFEEPINELLSSPGVISARAREKTERILQRLKRMMSDVLQWRPGAAVAPDGCSLAHTDRVITLEMTSAQKDLSDAYVRAFVAKKRWESFRFAEVGGTETETGSGIASPPTESGEGVTVPFLEEDGTEGQAPPCEESLEAERTAGKGSASTSRESHLGHEHRLSFIFAHPVAFATRYRKIYQALLADNR